MKNSIIYKEVTAMNSLSNKIALITGGTSGIGAACAVRFAKAGATVIVSGRNKEQGEKIVSEINSEGGKAVFCLLDVCNDDSIKAAAEFIKKEFGCLDILFNNAGVYPVTPPLEELTRESGSDILDINVSGVVMMTQACLPLLRESRGVILNNASVAGFQSYTAGQSYMYCGSKAAVIKITQLIAKKYGSEIRANAICPGVVRTPIYKRFDEERYKSGVPMGRVGEVEDVAAAANFLVSDDAAFINGAVLAVDGGQSL